MLPLVAAPADELAEIQDVPVAAVFDQNRWVVETVPGSFAMHDVVNDNLQNVSVFVVENGERRPGFTVPWTRVDHVWIQRTPERVEWDDIEGWTLKLSIAWAPPFYRDAPPPVDAAFPARTVSTVPISLDEYLASRYPSAYRLKKNTIRDQRLAQTSGGGRIVYDISGLGNVGPTVKAAIDRAKVTVSSLMPPDGEPIVIPILFSPLPANQVAFTTSGDASISAYQVVVPLGLDFNASVNNTEPQEANFYSSFSQSGYVWSGQQNVNRASNIVIVPYHLRQTVLDSTPSPAQLRPTILLSNTGTILYDQNRANGILAGYFDLEATLVHETLHALGLVSASIAICNSENAVTLPDLFAVSSGQSNSMFGAIRRLPTLPTRVFAALGGLEYNLHPGDENWHWLDDAISGQLIGAMDFSLSSGDLRPFTLYQSDLRAIDIVGYNISQSFLNPPSVPIPLVPIENAPDQERLPLFSWDSSGTNSFVTVYSTSTRTDTSILYQSEVTSLGTTTPDEALPANTQLWWQVTSLGDGGSFANGELRSFTTGSACDSIDFNRNTVFPEDQDVIDFFNVLAGGPCPYTPPAGEVCDIDFNNNTVFPEDQDVIDFFNVLAGQSC